jgi:lycopene cyclase domain-containing protein
VEGAQVSFFYLSALLISILGLALLDHRHKLAFAKTKRHFLLIGIPVLFFLAWDVVGITLGVFFRGTTPFLTGILVYQELPLEEIFFLIVLSYTSLLLLRSFEKVGKK